MLRSWMIISLLGMVGISSMGCQNKVHDENQALWKENRELRAKLADTEGRLRAAPDATQMASMQQSMQQEIASRDAKIAELQNQLQQPAPGQPQDNSLQGIEVTRDELFKCHAAGQLPMILFAHNVAEDSQGRFERGDWVRSSMCTGLHDGVAFETRNSVYVLIGPGHEQLASLKDVFSLF